MDKSISKPPFYLGDWCVIPEQCRLQNNESSNHIQPKLMEVLLFFVAHPAQVISTDELISACWQGQPMTDNPIHKTIAQLRKALGDASDSPKYIKTIPRKGYVLIAQISHEQLGSVQVEAYWKDQSPFVGSSPFQTHQKSIFFGRQQSIDDLLSQIETIGVNDKSAVCLSGSSGSGKTSFIQAGVIPQLLNPYKKFNIKFTQAVIWRANKEQSIDSLLRLLHQNDVFEPTLSCSEIQAKWCQDRNDFMSLLKGSDRNSGQRMILFIDQIEQWHPLIHKNESSEKESGGSVIGELFDLINALINSKQFLVIYSFRDELKPVVKDLPEYKQLSVDDFEFRLSEFKPYDHKTWVQATAQAAGLFFAENPSRHERLIDLIIHFTNQFSCQTSSIQNVLLKLFENKEGSQLTYGSYHGMGGTDGVIRALAEESFVNLSVAQQKVLTGAFMHLIKFESILSPQATLSLLELNEASEIFGPDLLNQMINEHLLKSEVIKGQVYVRLAEPSLSKSWDRLLKWIKANQADLLQKSELQLLTARWKFKNKQTHYLMSETDLAQLDKYDEQGFMLNSNEQRYILASRNQQKRNKLLKKILQFSAAALMVFMLGLALFGWSVNNQQSQSQAQLNKLVDYVAIELSPQLKAKGQLSILESTHEYLIPVIKDSIANNRNNPHLNAQAASLNILGELKFNHRQPEEAAMYFSEAEKLVNDAGSNNDSQLLAHLMLSQYWLGYLGFVEERYSQSRSYWLGYLKTALKLRSIQPNNESWKLEHSYALNNLGTLAEKTGALDEAVLHFTESIEIKSALLEQQPDDMTLLADLADSLSWQGKILIKQGFLTKALEAYQESAELTEALKSSNNGDNTKLYRESLAYHRIASLELDLGNLQKSVNYAEQAINKSLLLNELDTQNNNYKSGLIKLHLFVANLYHQQNQIDASLKHIQKANKIIEHFKINLSMSTKIAAYQMALKHRQATIFYHFGQAESALQAIDEGLLTWDDYGLEKNSMAQKVFIKLHVQKAEIMKQNQPDKNEMVFQEQIYSHLNIAWKQINNMLINNSENYQLMAINLVILKMRDEDISNHEYIDILAQSEYRNPEYFKPLVDAKLISLN